LDEKDEIFSDDSAFESHSDCMRADEEHEQDGVTQVNELSSEKNSMANPYTKSIKGPNLFFTQVEFDDF